MSNLTIDGQAISTEKTPIDLAREFMLGEVMSSALKQLRALDKPWLRLPETQQRNVIDEVRADVQAAIRKAVEIIATDDRTCFTAAVDSVTFKDGVKAVLTMPNTPASHELADTQGGRIWLVLEDPNRYTQQTAGVPQPEPDQAPLATA